MIAWIQDHLLFFIPEAFRALALDVLGMLVLIVALLVYVKIAARKRTKEQQAEAAVADAEGAKHTRVSGAVIKDSRTKAKKRKHNK